MWDRPAAVLLPAEPTTGRKVDGFSCEVPCWAAPCSRGRALVTAWITRKASLLRQGLSTIYSNRHLEGALMLQNGEMIEWPSPPSPHDCYSLPAESGHMP